jgi:hypothetical protein
MEIFQNLKNMDLSNKASRIDGPDAEDIFHTDLQPLLTKPRDILSQETLQQDFLQLQGQPAESHPESLEEAQVTESDGPESGLELPGARQQQKNQPLIEDSPSQKAVSASEAAEDVGAMEAVEKETAGYRFISSLLSHYLVAPVLARDREQEEEDKKESSNGNRLEEDWKGREEDEAEQGSGGGNDG